MTAEAFLDAAVARTAAQVSAALSAQMGEPFDATVLKARRAAVDAARLQVGAARDAAIAAFREVDAARTALEAARAAGRVADLPAAEDRVSAAAAAAHDARRRLTQARQALQGAAAAMVAANGTASAFGRLTRAAPIALLPVRLETRWFARDSTRYELRVRVFPDAVHLDAHQPLMTPVEQQAVTGYWTTRRSSGPDAPATLTAWHGLCEQFGEPRAGWLVAQLDPANLDGRQSPTTPTGEIPVRPTAPEDWADPVLARCLPDRWAVVGFARSQRVLLHWGSPVPPALQVSLDDATTVGPGDGPDDGDGQVNAGVRWLTDFATAETVGMAMRIPVEKPIARHLDRLLVFGVSATEDAPAGTRRLTELFSAHAATGAGLPGVGARTNNTEAARSGYRERPRDHAAAHRRLASLQLTRIGGRDAELVARVLGLDPVVLRRISGADRLSQDGIDDMHRALWYATGQRLLEEQVETDVADADIAFVRDHFVGRVRARGPLPPIRIDNQPYGLLPVVALDRWAGDATETRMRTLVNVLRTIRDGTLRFVDRPDQLPTTDDPQGSLVRALRVRAGTTTRRATSKTFVSQEAADSVALSMRAWWAAAIPQLRHGPVDVALEQGGMRLFQRQSSRTESGYATSRPLVAPEQDPATPLPAAVNYLAHLGAGTLTQANARGHQVNGSAARSLLYLLLREAYDSIARLDLEQRTLFLQALRELGARPVGELEQLATDAIDLWTNRMDAWATSVATQRLDGLASVASHRVHVGGFGWVERLVPPGEGAVAGGPVVDDPDSAGYLHLPSAAQARTGAVLHGAFEAHSGTGPDNEAFRLQLTSARVRAARALLAGLREGQSLAALLGYRLERSLVEAGVGHHVPAVRRIATAATGPTDPADSSRDHLARDPATTETTDGVVVAFLAGNGTLESRLVAQSVPASDVHQVVTLALELEDALDALSDLLVAEGTHQALSGNAARAAAAFDLMAEGGGAAPDPVVTATPAAGVQLGLRVLVPLPAAVATGWPGDDRRARALAEPRLNAWAAAALGPPTAIGFRVTLRAADGSRTAQNRTLADADLCPLDVVALSAAAPDEAPLLALLRRRIAAGAPAGTVVTVDSGRRGPASRSLADALVVGHALQRVLADARPMRAADLVVDGSDGTPATVDQADLTARARRTRTRVRDLRTALAGPPGLDRWWPAAVLLGDADPARPATVAAWRAELRRRLAAVEEAADPADRLGHLAGPGLPILPVFTAPNAGELRAAFGSADQQAVLNEGDPTRPARWLHDTARVRLSVGQLDLYVTLAAAFDAPVSLRVAHLPVADTVWAGERITAAGPRLALLAATPLPVDLGAPVAGLLVDGWTETMPQQTLTTGLAFSYDAPKPQAPQTILLAVPPNRAAPWRFEDVEAALTETLTLVQLRLMTPVGLGALGDYLPALYLSNDERSTLEGA